LLKHADQTEKAVAKQANRGDAKEIITSARHLAQRAQGGLFGEKPVRFKGDTLDCTIVTALFPWINLV